MLEFIYGKSGTGKTQLCINNIRERLQADPQGPALLLLCPDHMSFQLERQLGEATKELGGFARAHVLGITRLAYQILNRAGATEHITLDDLGKQLLLSKLLQRLNLKVLKQSKTQPHFANTVAVLIDEFKAAGIYPWDLEALQDKIEDSYLRAKVKDLVAVYEALQAEMGEIYRDKEDVLTEAVKLIPVSPWLKDAEIWWDGFDDFTYQHYNLLRGLCRVAEGMKITLCIPDLKDKHASELDIYHHIYTMYEGAKAVAEEFGVQVVCRELQEDYRHRDRGLAYLADHFMNFPMLPCKEQTGVKIVEVANRRLECDAVAADIIRLCRDEDYVYQDIGILLRDDETYGELLNLVLKDYGIQAFWDKKTQINHHPLAELLRSGLDLLANWQYESIFRCLKTGFFKLAEEDVDLLENYVLGAGIKGKKNWLKEEPWTSMPEGMAKRFKPFESAEAYLEYINGLRLAVGDILKTWAEKMKQCETIGEYTRELYDFLMVLQLPETLEKWRDQGVAQKDLRLAKEHQQIWAHLMSLLDQLMTLGAEDSCNLAEFTQLILDGLDSMQMGLIPPGWDYVTVAPFEHNTLNNKRAIYILGASEGVMPRQVKATGLLTEKERYMMKSLGLELNQGPWEENYRERYLLYRGFSLSRDYLWVSYPLADQEGGSIGKSVVVDWLESLLPECQRAYVPLSGLAQSVDMELTTPQRSLANLARALNEFRAQGQLKEYWPAGYNYLLTREDLPVATVLAGLFTRAPQGKLPKKLARKLFLKEGKLRGSVTRFETFTNCPFKHFLAYGLDLQPRKEARFQAPNLGILLHEVMRAFGDYLQQENRRWGDVEPEECARLCQDILDKTLEQPNYAALKNSAGFNQQAQRIKRLAQLSLLRLIEFNRNSAFDPAILEGYFGPESNLPAIVLKMDDFVIEIVGQIDRIDKHDNYFLVIDYKSGKAEISMLDIFYGLKLQLLTYLLVGYNTMLAKTGEALPAAMMYCFLKRANLVSKQRLGAEELAKEVRKELTMPGWFLNNPEVIEQIDDKQEYIKISLTKNKEINKNNLTSVKSQEEFAILMDYLKEIYRQTGRKIVEGESTITPYQLGSSKACTTCGYSAVCGFDKDIPGFGARELEKIADEGIMKKIKDILGIKEDEA